MQSRSSNRGGVMTNHEAFIERAYVLARQAAVNGDHPFSALLVHSGQIAMECLNTVNTHKDATRHPELDILRLAAADNALAPLDQMTLYASTEPCAMCCGAIYWSGVQTLVYGCPTEVLGEIAGGSFVVPSRELFASATRDLNVIGPVLAEQGAEIHRSFW